MSHTPLEQNSDPLIRIRNLRFAYPGPPHERFELALDELDITPGEHTAIIGPSGSGKTTLLHLIAGILVPESGSIELAGEPISRLSDERRRALRARTVGMVFQEFELLDYLSALDNILVPLRVARSLRVDAEARARARDLATSLGVAHTLRRRPPRLSQGERQRIAICRALIAGPSLIMGDEPTGNLDPASATTALDLLFKQARDHDATLLIVTHNHAILDRFTRVIDLPALARAEVRA